MQLGAEGWEVCRIVMERSNPTLLLRVPAGDRSWRFSDPPGGAWNRRFKLGTVAGGTRCYLQRMSAEPVEITLQLVPPLGLKLARMAEREGTSVEAVAERVLSEAVDSAPDDPAELGALLDSIPGFHERYLASVEQVRRGETVPTSELLER